MASLSLKKKQQIYQLASSAYVVVASPGKVLRKLIGVTKGSGVIMRIRLKH
jgi:hypothetical protein